MAKIENAQDGERHIYGLPKVPGQTVGPFVIGKATKTEKGDVINGTGEIPDDVLDELIAKDKCVRGLFEAGGGLTRVAAKAKAKDPEKTPEK